MRHWPEIFVVAAACLALPAQAAPLPLAAHHAEYKLSLMSSKDQSVTAATGTMSYDVLDACTDWTTAQHMVINLTDQDGQDVKMVSDYATVESKDGTKLDFHTRQLTDDAVTQQLDGHASLERSGGRGVASFSSPEVKRVLLPAGTLLPMAHTKALIEAAIAGRKFLAVPLFDGTGADGAQDTFVTLENWGKPVLQKFPALSLLSLGHVHIAFFDRGDASETPNYEIALRYFENGVADDLAMDFGDFVMGGKLVRFALENASHC